MKSVKIGLSLLLAFLIASAAFVLPAEASVGLCQNIFKSSVLPRFLSPKESQFLRLLKRYSESKSADEKSDIQSKELLKISQKSRATIVAKTAGEPREFSEFALKFSAELDQQLKVAIKSKTVTTKFAVDWASRYANLLSTLYAPKVKVSSQLGFSSDVLFKGFVTTNNEYKFFVKDRTLSELKRFWLSDSFYEHAKARDLDNNPWAKKDFDIFITDQDLGFEFFNKSINLSTQVAGFIYEPMSYDGSVGNPGSFMSHDFVHYDKTRSFRFEDPKTRSVIDTFQFLYNKKLESLSEDRADLLSKSMFLAEHEQTQILEQIWFALKGQLSSDDIRSNIGALPRQADIPEIPDGMPAREGDIIAELILKALKANGHVFAE